MADVFPPSYEYATTRDAWTIIAPYVSPPDVCSTLLVSRRWHGIFAPLLWGEPTARSVFRDDAVNVALTRFVRALKLSRLCVRQLTHTLQLPSALLSEIHGWPPSTWLRELLEYLPNLQSLLVSELPFFDYKALIALRNAGPYNLRLFVAWHESNATPVELADGLMRSFPSLVFLDLSFTTAGRSPRVHLALAHLHGLQVLKLRGVGLRDGDLEGLAQSIQARVRLLDVRRNLLTDLGLKCLVKHCFQLHDEVRLVRRGLTDLGPQTSALLADSIATERLSDHLLALFTQPLTGRSALEELPHVGITHLYIAENNCSSHGLEALVQAGKLNVLDGGTIPLRNGGFIQALNSPASQGLTYLRVHHSVVTEGQDADRVNTHETFLSVEEEMIQWLLSKRQEATRKTNDTDRHPSLHPSNCPHLQTLVLTGIPAYDTSACSVISSLTSFISACADESLLAALQAQLDYSLPPGQNRLKAVRQRCKQLFALRSIVLEIDSSTSRPLASWNQQDAGISVTGDVDSQNMWAAAADDFSFFKVNDEDQEESYLPSSPGRTNPPATQVIDVVAALAAFRKEKRDEYAKKRLQKGEIALLAPEGHWDGEVRIVRNAQ